MTTVEIINAIADKEDVCAVLCMGAEFLSLVNHPGGDELVWSCSCGESSGCEVDLSVALMRIVLEHLYGGHAITLRRG